MRKWKVPVSRNGGQLPLPTADDETQGGLCHLKSPESSEGLGSQKGPPRLVFRWTPGIRDKRRKQTPKPSVPSPQSESGDGRGSQSRKCIVSTEARWGSRETLPWTLAYQRGCAHQIKCLEVWSLLSCCFITLENKMEGNL